MKDQNIKDNYQLLINKLDDFIRKYYKNHILRGSIISGTVFLASLLFIAFLEYYGHFNTGVRTLFFYAFLLINLTVVAYFVAIPLLKLFRLGHIISHHQAATIIGKHFANVEDRLLNTLQLKEASEKTTDPRQAELIRASINQKTESLRPVPFATAINFGENKKYIRYIAIPFVFVLATLVFAPHILIDSTGRIIEHRTYFERVAPFQFELLNDSLYVLRQDDFPVELKITGDEIPAEVYIIVGENRYRMNKDGKIYFNHKIRNLRDNVSFRFHANGFYSRSYELKVNPRPTLRQFAVYLDYPEYTGKGKDTLRNEGDLTIPQGTQVRWQFSTESTDELSLMFTDTTISAERGGENRYTYRKTFMDDAYYYILPSNAYVNIQDSIRYNVNVIPDAYPDISVDEEQDSISSRHRYFSGELSDDYGLTRLTFNYRFVKSDDKSKVSDNYETTELRLNRGELIQAFYYHWDMNTIDVKAGDELEYFFEVWDNDAVNGRKSSRTSLMRYQAPGLAEIEEQARIASDEIKSRIEDAIRETAELRRELDEISRNLMNKQDFSWQDEQNVESLLDRQEQLRQQIEDIQKEYQENIMKQSEYKDMDEDIKEKHSQLQELFDDILDDETQALLEEIKKLMEERMTDEIRQKLQEMEHRDRTTERELDRMLELYKQLEFDQKLQETIDKLEQLAQEQRDLSEQTDSEESDMEDLMEQQQQLSEKFEDIKEDFKELDEKNKEMENQRSMKDPQEEMSQIEQKMQESMEQLQQQDKQKAKDSQQESSEKMEELAEQLAAMKMQMEMDAIVLNYRTLRQILENLLHFSFDQEDLLERLGITRDYNPQYIEIGREQSDLRQYARLIEDSLYALSKKVVQIQSFVNREMNDINYFLGHAIQNISDRNVSDARRYQQSVMTSANNLAVLLSEILDQMQEQMAMQMEGDQMIQMPGEGEPSLSEMQQMQEQLMQQMEQMQQNGEGQGEGEDGGEEYNEQMARMAAQQEQIRRQLREMRRQMEEQLRREGGEGMQDIEEKMEEVEKDLLHKQLTEETIKRQREIMVRLLESEEAMRKQDIDEERQAEEARDYFRHQPPSLEEYQRSRQREVELLRTVPPTLSNFYRMKVRDYFERIRD